MDWYSLRVISGKEKNIETSIMREVNEQDIMNEIEEVFVPYEKVIEVRNNKKRIKEKMFFPGYILIKMNLTANTKYIIENTPGVLSFVGPKGKVPVPLRDKEIKRIFGEVERKEGAHDNPIEHCSRKAWVGHGLAMLWQCSGIAMALPWHCHGIATQQHVYST